MNRCTDRRTSEVVGRAWRHVAPFFDDQFPCDVFMADPVFAGLHDTETLADGRSYHDTMHVCYPWDVTADASHRRTTIVIPRLPALYGVVHEFGHVLHERHAFDFEPVPVSRYARTDRYEAFAEAFASHIWGDLEDEEARIYFEHWEAA